MNNETKGSDKTGTSVISAMQRSKLYRDYRKAFTRATGLPLDIHAPDEMKVHRPIAAKAAPFCALMAKANASCSACYALQRELEDKAQVEARTIKCFAGLCETEVPVRVGENVIAFLHTGHILVDRPDKAHFNRVADELIRWGTHVDLKQAEEAYFATRVLPREHYKALVQLLSIFAEHLAASGSQITLQQNQAEPSAVTRARKIIDLQSQDEVSLGQVAKLVNVSANYFSELFHKTTGIRFVDYVARVRVEKAKTMLLDRRARVSGVAYDVGFKSLSQFNRAFKKFAGEAPSKFRKRSGSAA